MDINFGNSSLCSLKVEDEKNSTFKLTVEGFAADYTKEISISPELIKDEELIVYRELCKRLGNYSERNKKYQLEFLSEFM